MKLTDYEIEQLRPILIRETAMIGGSRVFAAQLLDRMQGPRHMTPEQKEILHRVANHFGIEVSHILGKARQGVLPTARCVAAYFLHESGLGEHEVCDLLMAHRSMFYDYKQRWDYPHVAAHIKPLR
jgi:hypothetical protein